MPTSWEDMVLAYLGAPKTKENETFLQVWEKSEGGVTVEHINNPLNTTLDRAKYPGYQYAPAIPEYPNLQVGAQETARTLLGGYPAITSALKHNAVQGSIGTNAFIEDLNKWVGHGPSPTPSSYTEGIASNLAHSAGYAGSAADWTSFDITGSGGGPSIAGAGGAVIGAVSSAAGGLFDAITNPIERGLLRVGLVLGGFMLAMVGLYLIVNAIGLAPGLGTVGGAIVTKGKSLTGGGSDSGGGSPRRKGDAAIERGEEVTRTDAPRPATRREKRQVKRIREERKAGPLGPDEPLPF